MQNISLYHFDRHDQLYTNDIDQAVHTHLHRVQSLFDDVGMSAKMIQIGEEAKDVLIRSNQGDSIVSPQEGSILSLIVLTLRNRNDGYLKER